MPVRHGPDDPALGTVLALMHAAFRGMEGRVDPPSSIGRLDLAALQKAAMGAEVWSVGAPVTAAVILTPKPATLYIGKLAVAEQARAQGMARKMIALADSRARDLDLPTLTLETRIELVENHAVFAALGFAQVEQTSHPGYTRPTAITWQRDVSANAPQ